MGKAFGNGGFANARVTNQKRVVLAASAENLNAALNFGIATDKRVNIAFAGFCVQIDAVFCQRAFFGFRFGFTFDGCMIFCRIVRTLNRTVFAVSRVFGNAMCDEVHCIVARHILFLQEVGGVAFSLSEDRDEDVGARNFGSARGLDVDRRTLNYTLESRGWNRF